MASTSPTEFERIQHLLPTPENEVFKLAKRIVDIVLVWQQALAKKYPTVTKMGRPIFSYQDTPGVISVETYLKGELLTYSIRTLELLLEDYQLKKSQNINGSEIVLDQVAEQHGYRSAALAENIMNAKGQ